MALIIQNEQRKPCLSQGPFKENFLKHFTTSGKDDSPGLKKKQTTGKYLTINAYLLFKTNSIKYHKIPLSLK